MKYVKKFEQYSVINEEESSYLQKLIRQAGWAGESMTPEDIANQVKKLSDSTLVLWSQSKDSPFPGTPLEFQQKLVKMEMEKRGLK